MSNTNGSMIRTDIKRFSFFASVRKYIKKWKATSGFNTFSTYANNSETLFKKEGSSEKSALFDSLDILNQYMDDLLHISPDSSNHDIHLNTQLAVKRTEMSPLVPYSCMPIPYTIQSSLFAIYRLLISIHADFMELQNLFQIIGGSDYLARIVRSEHSVIDIIRESIRDICDTGRSDSDRKFVSIEILSTFSEITNSFKHKESVDRYVPERCQISTILERVDDSNRRISTVILFIRSEQ